MSEELYITKESKEVAYKTLVPQIEALVAGESNLIANLANISSAIKMTFNHLWVGFYLVENDQLVLGPFQGPIACTRIEKWKGLCGTSWGKESTIVVADVNLFEGHIACSSLSVSEIVVPIKNNQNEVIGVLDVDAVKKGEFDDIDQLYLEKISAIIKKTLV